MQLKNKYMYLYTALIWVKLYFVHRVYFNFPIHSWQYEGVIVLGTLSSALIIAVLTILIARKKVHFGFLISSAIVSILVVSNTLYYRFFNDFITLPVLFQSGNV